MLQKTKLLGIDNMMELLILSLDVTHIANPILLLQQLCFIYNQEDFSCFAEAFKKYYMKNKHSYDLFYNWKEIDVLLEKAGIIRKLIQKNHFDFDEAILLLSNNALRCYLSSLPLSYSK